MGLAMRFEATPDVHDGDARHWAFGTMGVSEWLLSGTTRDGRKIAVRGYDHYEFRGGKVVRKDPMGRPWRSAMLRRADALLATLIARTDVAFENLDRHRDVSSAERLLTAARGRAPQPATSGRSTSPRK